MPKMLLISQNDLFKSLHKNLHKNLLNGYLPKASLRSRQAPPPKPVTQNDYFEPVSVASAYIAWPTGIDFLRDTIDKFFLGKRYGKLLRLTAQEKASKKENLESSLLWHVFREDAPVSVSEYELLKR